MTRVAISFSGLPRFPTNLPTSLWRGIISRYNADVFVHTWLDYAKQPEIFDRILCCFAPKVFKYEPSRQFPIHEYQQRVWPSVSPYSVFSAFTSVFESMELVNKYSTLNNFQYDYVIRARFDTAVSNLELQPVEGVAVTDEPSKHVLRFSYNDQDLFGVEDLLAYGSQENMKKYANTIHNIPRLYHEENVDMCSEVLLTANLISQGVSIDFKPMRAKIIRRISDNK